MFTPLFLLGTVYSPVGQMQIRLSHLLIRSWCFLIWQMCTERSVTACAKRQVFTGDECHTLWWLTGLCWCNRCREENVVTSSYWYNYLCRWRVSYPVTTCMCLQVKSVILCDYWHVFTGEACHTPWLLMCFHKMSVNCYTHDYDCWQAFTSEKCYTL